MPHHFPPEEPNRSASAASAEALPPTMATHRQEPLPRRRRTEIGPENGWPLIDLAELWRYRDLLGILAGRDIKVKYRQAVVGIAWVLLQPLATLAVFTILFGLMKQTPVEGHAPYALSLFCGLLPWQLFASSLTTGSGSLVNNRHIVTKVYFPRLLLPLACVMAALVDFAVASLVLGGLMLWYQVAPTASLLWFPLWLALTSVTAFSAALILSGLNALYRDVGYVVPFLVQLGFFISPVVYETFALIPAKWQPLFALNPLVAVLEGFRWIVLGATPARPLLLLLSLSTSLILFAASVLCFRRMEHHLADRI